MSSGVLVPVGRGEVSPQQCDERCKRRALVLIPTAVDSLRSNGQKIPHMSLFDKFEVGCTSVQW